VLAWGVLDLAKLAILQNISHQSGIIVRWMYEVSPRVFLHVLRLKNLERTRCQLPDLLLKGFIFKCITFSIVLGQIKLPRRTFVGTNLSEQYGAPQATWQIKASLRGHLLQVLAEQDPA
jgi:hypothetical protein